MDFLNRIFGKVSRFFNFFAIVWFIGVLVLLIISTTARYFLKTPFSFTEELVGLLIITMLLLAIPLISHEDKHIKVTMLSDHFRGWLKIGASVIGYGVTIAFTTWFGIASLEWVKFAFDLNLKTANTGIWLTPWMVILPLVMFLVAISALLALINIVMGFDAQARKD